MIPDPNGEDERTEVVRVIDWSHPEENDFLVCSQFWVTGEMYTRRPDLVGFVNGLPLVLMEFKAVDQRLETAYTGNLSDYKDTIPHLFWYNGLIILSNGSQSRVGSVSAGWEHFGDWKRVESETEAESVSLETVIRGTCDPDRFLDLVENFTLFMDAPGGLIYLPFEASMFGRDTVELSRVGSLSGSEGLVSLLNRAMEERGSEQRFKSTSRVVKKIYDRLQAEYDGDLDESSNTYSGYRRDFYTQDEIVAMATDFGAIE